MKTLGTLRATLGFACGVMLMTTTCPQCHACIHAGVCLRVKHHVEALFAEKLEERRREVAQQDAGTLATGCVGGSH